ncbi:hypothetical protein O6H91_15G003000 [Diphasiastrum complanatum]|uniref:Uncharacterized protein n=1 Tax=Diphasiastrum complanatum TaxID=34168 RepID=A0ACC2BFC9_DIPCM|nr:hypothetical protein O6H91_15G003000 [Diphasiastrum complanatum]
MNSASSQPQFRYTQPPSKVLHVRNLPWECTEEELIELGKPFGKIVNTKCNVGANRNQAFVEFADLNQAISMVSYFATSSEPAQVRGKTVYLQYSNRQEIVNGKTTGDVAGNVLLVTFEGIEAGDVSIDVLHLVFSAFGFVHKIATFEKTAGFQALVQFTDATTASAARNALDGRSIPRYLLPEHVETCHLRISFSAHTDLQVKFQSHRSRDYTNPNLPVAPSAINGIAQDFCIGPDGKRKELESNVLLASIENMQYAVTIDVIHTVFSAFGTVQKIAIFEKAAGFQALVQYPDVATAVTAKEALEGHCIYDGGYCKLHVSYSRHTDLNVKVNNDRSRDYTNPLPLNQPLVTDPSIVAGANQMAPTASTAYLGNQFSTTMPAAPSGSVSLPEQRWNYNEVQAAPNVHGSSSFIPGPPPRPSYVGPPATAAGAIPSRGPSVSNHVAAPGVHFSAPPGVSGPHPSSIPGSGVPPGHVGANQLHSGDFNHSNPFPQMHSMPPYSPHRMVPRPGSGGVPSSAVGPHQYMQS